MLYTLFLLPIFAAVETAGQPLIERLVGIEAAELSVEGEPVVEEERRRQMGITSRLVNPRTGRPIPRNCGPQCNSGILQMRVGAIWSFVCDDNFDQNNNGVNVACREMGWTGGHQRDGVARRSNGRALSNNNFVDDVRCTGHERTLADCPRRASGEDCWAGEAVYVSCFGSGPKARLVNSSGAPTNGRSGILQMKVGTSWKYVCDDNFEQNKNGPNVVCRELGFAPVTPSLNPNAIGYYATQGHARAPNDYNFVDDVRCTGRESSITQCPRRNVGEDCWAHEAVSINCIPAPVSGCSATLYEHSMNGENWTLRETGRFINGNSAWSGSGFKTNAISSLIVSGTGCSLIVADNYNGGGTTHTFGEGRHAHAFMLTSPIGNNRISSVKLSLTMNSRLVNSSGQKIHGLSGILQMKVGNGSWKYVCDHWFSNNNNGPAVACREMGFSGGSQADATAPNADNFYDDIRCTGSETSLVDCERRNGENCAAGDAVLLTCTASG